MAHHQTWAQEAGVTEIDFTYCVLYGTKRISNKKDWHILRTIAERLKDGVLVIPPAGRWDCQFQKNGVTVTVTRSWTPETFIESGKVSAWPTVSSVFSTTVVAKPCLETVTE